MSLISPDYAKERLDYDPVTGVFRWRTNRIKSLVGKSVGVLRKDGYVVILLQGKLVLAHRLAWAIMMGEWPPEQVDHINLCRSDNRWENLRKATRRQNARNTPLRSDNVSGYKGVSWDKNRKKWRADIKLSTKNKHLGMFASPEEAASAYADAANRYFGEYRRVA